MDDPKDTQAVLSQAVRDIHRQAMANTDPRNRPPLDLLSRQALGKLAKDPIAPGPLTPIRLAGHQFPIGWKDSEGREYLTPV